MKIKADVKVKVKKYRQDTHFSLSVVPVVARATVPTIAENEVSGAATGGSKVNGPNLAKSATELCCEKLT